MVGLVWTVAALQSEAIMRWDVRSPIEFTIGIRETLGATLGGFAEGWAEPGSGFHDWQTCVERHVLLRHELYADFDPRTVALHVGDRIEQAFGTTHRRYLAHRGPYEGEWDPRIG